MWNPQSGNDRSCLWNHISGIQLKESGIPLTIRTHNPCCTDKLNTGILLLEFRIQGCLRYPYMAWDLQRDGRYLPFFPPFIINLLSIWFVILPRHVNGSMFFFKGDKYWSYNEQINQVNPGYPRTLAAWGGVSVDVDAAFVWTDGYAYFFKDDIYFRYNNATQRVQDGYPRNISSFWKGVPNNVSAVFRYSWPLREIRGCKKVSAFLDCSIWNRKLWIQEKTANKNL